MKSLDKTDTKRRLELAEQLTVAENALGAALEAYNRVVADAWSPVQSAIDDYNALVEEANGFKDDVASQIEEYMDARSESWQEGERGQAYAEWRDNWQAAYFETVDLEQPEPLEVEDCNAADELRDLEEEVAA